MTRVPVPIASYKGARITVRSVSVHREYRHLTPSDVKMEVTVRVTSEQDLADLNALVGKVIWSNGEA